MPSKLLLLIVPVLAVFPAAPPLAAAGLVVGDCKGRGINVVGKKPAALYPAVSSSACTYPAFKYSAVMETAAGVVASCSAADNLVVWAPGDGRVAVNMSGQSWFLSRDHVHLGIEFNVTVLSPAVKKHASSPPPPPPVRAQGGGVAAVLAAGAAVVASALLF